MRWSMVVVCAVLSAGCRRSQSEDQKPVTPGAIPGMTPTRVSPASSLHLELAGVHERHQDLRTAMEHLSKAASSADSALQRAQALASLGRVKQAAGDRDGAIEALEQARTELSRIPSGAGGAIAVGPVGPAADDTVIRLARLRAEKGETEKALELCKAGRSAAGSRWQREPFLRLEIELLRGAGTLDRRIADAEKTLDTDKPDEDILRFLAVALAPKDSPEPGSMIPLVGPMGMAPQPAQPAPPEQPVSSTLVRVRERLLELHPDDPSERTALLSLLERAGRIDEAAALLQATPVPQVQCPGAYSMVLRSPSIQRAADVVRLRARGGQRDRALADTALLASTSKQEGIAPLLVAAELYQEQGAVARAEDILRRASAEAASRDERRQVAFARRSLLERAGKPAELKALLGQWAKAEDPCLRAAAQPAPGSLGGVALPAMTPTPPAGSMPAPIPER